MRVQVDRELADGERRRRERIVPGPATAPRGADRSGGAGREGVSA